MVIEYTAEQVKLAMRAGSVPRKTAIEAAKKGDVAPFRAWLAWSVYSQTLKEMKTCRSWMDKLRQVFSSSLTTEAYKTTKDILIQIKFKVEYVG